MLHCQNPPNKSENCKPNPLLSKLKKAQGKEDIEVGEFERFCSDSCEKEF